MLTADQKALPCAPVLSSQTSAVNGRAGLLDEAGLRRGGPALHFIAKIPAQEVAVNGM